MHYYLLLLSISVLLIACEPTKRAAPPLPPGVERGKTWDEAPDFGYDDDIYVTPAYIAYPLKGNRNMKQALHRTYRMDVCSKSRSEAIIRYVINEEGQVLDIHPITFLEKQCVDQLRNSIKQFEFFPAEYNDQSVKTMMAITISRARL